jgi:hypothetical protein
MRVYFSDLSKVDFHSIENGNTVNSIRLVNKTAFTRIFSSEGIFHIKDNKLMRAQIKDQPIENMTIQNTEFLVDKSSIKYDVDWYHINPYHIAETIDVYTYALLIHTSPTHTSPDKVQLILEKQEKNVNSIYFLINDNDNNDNNDINDIKNTIVTFLSGLNLC